MKSPAYEFARWLQDQNLGIWGGSGDWSLHVGREPDAPANAVTLYDTAGLAPLNLDGGEMRQPGLQVRVRSVDYLKGFERADAIRAKLVLPEAVVDGVTIERTIGTGYYVQITPVADILPLGRDENDRHIFVANYQLIRQEVEAS